MDRKQFAQMKLNRCGILVLIWLGMGLTPAVEGSRYSVQETDTALSQAFALTEVFGPLDEGNVTLDVSDSRSALVIKIRSGKLRATIKLRRDGVSRKMLIVSAALRQGSGRVAPPTTARPGPSISAFMLALRSRHLALDRHVSLLFAANADGGLTGYIFPKGGQPWAYSIVSTNSKGEVVSVRAGY
jgi:hypothetical protein